MFSAGARRNFTFKNVEGAQLKAEKAFESVYVVLRVIIQSISHVFKPLVFNTESSRRHAIIPGHQREWKV